jgi:hypothetical protein
MMSVYCPTCDGVIYYTPEYHVMGKTSCSECISKIEKEIYEKNNDKSPS